MGTARDSILALFKKQKVSPPPAFSGLVHVTAAGLEREGLTFYEIHRDADQMARAAASAYRLTGFPSAVVPFDFCVPAEALGAQIDFREQRQFEFPRAAKPLFESAQQLHAQLTQHAGDVERGRIPAVCEAIVRLKREIGGEAVVGALLTGPFTLLSILVEYGALFTEMKRDPGLVSESLLLLSSFLVEIGRAYHAAGADFLTVHEMGGSPSFLGPKHFDQFVIPALKKLIVDLPRPRVLAVCGKIEERAARLAEINADALSVDQSNDLAALRAVLPNELLFGNIDPVEILARGDKAQVRQAVRGAREAGADAVWPGCDLYPVTPPENLRAMLA